MLRRAAQLTARRALSTAALPEVAPVTMFGTAGRYANALYAAAAKNKALEAVQADLVLLKETLNTSPALLNFCTDPSLGRDQKAKGITEVLTAAKANDTTKKALATLAEGGRLGDVTKVIDMYADLITAAKGEVKAVITSAEALPQAEIDSITKQLYTLLVSNRHPAAAAPPSDAPPLSPQRARCLLCSPPCPLVLCSPCRLLHTGDEGGRNGATVVGHWAAR